MHILAVIEHASRRIRILSATAHPTAGWAAQTARNLVMDLEDAGCTVKYLIRDRDGKYPTMFDAVLADAGIEIVRSGVRVRRMNALHEFEVFYNDHRPHQGIANARPLAPLPAPITDPDQIAYLAIYRRDRLGGVLYEYQHAA